MADGRVKIYENFKNHIDVNGAATLRIYNVEIGDEAIYCCEVHYSGKSAISCVQAFVLGKKIFKKIAYNFIKITYNYIIFPKYTNCKFINKSKVGLHTMQEVLFEKHCQHRNYINNAGREFLETCVF